MQSLIDLGRGVDVDIFVERRDPERVQRDLYYSMQISRSSLLGKSDISADYDQLESKLTSSQYIRSGLSSQQSLYDFIVMLTVIGDSEEDLRWRLANIRKHLIQSSLKFIPLDYRHLDAWMSSLPLAHWDKKMLKRAKRNILGHDFGAAYPFTSYALNDNGGRQRKWRR